VHQVGFPLHFESTLRLMQKSGKLTAYGSPFEPLRMDERIKLLN